MMKNIIIFIFVGFYFLSSGQNIRYEVSMPKPQNHYYHVEMQLEGFSKKTVDVKMPVWTPGSYLVREFAKSVNIVKAFSGDKELEVKKTNKNTWRIYKGKHKNIRVVYDVYAFEVSVRTSFLDLTHGFISGTSVFMYVDGFKDLEGEVEIFPYKDFRFITTALEQKSEGVTKDGSQVFVFESYDQLVDCPIEIGNQHIFHFDAAGVRHTVAMYNEGNYDEEKLKKDMAKVVESATSVFEDNPNKKYVFIIHNMLDAQGGLEHMNSTVLSVYKWGYTGQSYLDFLQLVAHEYFHLWNVKRIRPITLGPFDYDKENYTTLLWVMEGFTSYYEKMILLRAGFYNDEQFLNKMFSSLNYVEGSVGARVQPVAHASFDAWIKAYRPNENSHNTTMSYYSRGAVMAMLLDAKMIANSNGTKKLDDFMRFLYIKYYKQKKRGFTEEEFKSDLERFVGEDLTSFFQKYIYGTEIPDYKTILDPLGLEINYVGKPKASVGMTVTNSSGKTIVKRIRAGSPAEEAGISVGDEIIGINGYRVDAESLNSYFKTVQENEQIEVLYARGDQLMFTKMKVQNYERPQFEYKVLLENETDERNYHFWLKRL